MFSSQEPTICKRCGSTKIYFDVDAYVKDKNGKDTTEPMLGIWLCEECGNTLGRKMGKDDNEIY